MTTAPRAAPPTAALIAIACFAACGPSAPETPNTSPATSAAQVTVPVTRYQQTHWGELSRFGPSLPPDSLNPPPPPLDSLRTALDAEQALRHSGAIEALVDELEQARSTRSISASEQRHDVFFRPTVVNWISRITAAHREAVAASITGFADQLDRRGTHLVVVFVPNKLDTLAPLLVPGAGSTSIAPEQTRLLIELAEHGIDFIDLRSRFRAAAREGELPFHRYDHHWSPHGIELAADALGAHLAGSPYARFSAGSRSRFERRRITIPEPASSIGFADTKPPGAARTFELQTYRFDGRPVLNDPGSPVAVIGDSNVLHLSPSTTGISAGFHAALSYRLGLPLAYVARSGTGASVAPQFRAHYLESPPRVVLMVVGSLVNEPPEPWPITPLVPSEDAETLPGDGTVVVSIEHASPVPDPKNLSYKEALVAYAATIPPPPGSSAPGKKVRLLTWAFRDRTPVGTPLDSGSTHTLTLRPFELECGVNPKLESVQQLDDTGLVLEPTYWFDPYSPPAAATPR